MVSVDAKHHVYLLTSLRSWIISVVELVGKRKDNAIPRKWNYAHAPNSPSAKNDSDTGCYTDHAGSGRESRDSHVGMYRAAQGSKTELSVSSDSMAVAIVTIM